MLTGFIVTFFCTPETKNLSLEDLSLEDQSKFDGAPTRGSGESDASN